MDTLFVADALSSFKIYKDTTFAMMREARKRGHRVFACEPRHLVWQRGSVVQADVQAITLTGTATDTGTPSEWFRIDS